MLTVHVVLDGEAAGVRYGYLGGMLTVHVVLDGGRSDTLRELSSLARCLGSFTARVKFI